MAKESIGDTPERDSVCDPDSPLDPEARRVWLEEMRRESRQNYFEAIREHDEAMKDLEKEKGILERLFGYRTSV